MGIWDKKKNGDYLIKIVECVTKTAADVGHLKDNFDEHAKAGYAQRDMDRKWQTSINEKITDCPEKDKINNIETCLKNMVSEKAGMSKLCKAIYLAIATAGVIVGIVGWLYKILS